MAHSTTLRLIAITSVLTALTACVGQNESASIQNSGTGIGVVLGSSAAENGSNNIANDTPTVQGVSHAPAPVAQDSSPAEPVNAPVVEPVDDPVVDQPVSDPVIEQPASNPVDEQPASEPLTNNDNATLVLTWEPSSETLDGYTVAYGSSPETATHQISDVKAFSGSFDFAAPSLQYASLYDLGLHPGDNVCFKVRSYNANGISDWSEAICGVIPQISA